MMGSNRGERGRRQKTGREIGGIRNQSGAGREVFGVFGVRNASGVRHIVFGNSIMVNLELGVPGFHTRYRTTNFRT